MLVRHFMTRAPITLSPDKSCGDALQTFRRNRIRRAPIVKDDAVVGIVSERDLLRVLPGTVAQSSSEAGKASMDTTVGQVVFANGVYGTWNNGYTAPTAGDEDTVWQHCRVAAYAEKAAKTLKKARAEAKRKRAARG